MGVSAKGFQTNMKRTTRMQGPTEIMYSFADLVCIIIITSVLGTVEMRFKHVQVQVNILTYNTSPVQTFNEHKP